MRRFLIAALCAFLPWPAAAEQGPKWLCVADKSSGFVFRDNEWQSSEFETGALRWVFSAREIPVFEDPAASEGDSGEEAAAATRLAYSLSREGQDWPRLQCQAREVFSVIQCEFGEYAFFSKYIFRLNLQTNRFMHVAPNGYVEGGEARGAAPAITIGSCSLI